MKDRTARGTALVNLIALAARRAHRGGHRHAHLRRRRVPVLRDAQRHGEEDADVGVRLVAAHRAHRDQPQRRRRARPGDPDQRQRRHLHGVAAGHDDPLLRGRRPADGPGDRRRAGHEAEERPTTRSSAATWPATTRCLLFVSSSGHGKRTPLDAFNRQGRGGQGVRGMRVTEARGGVVAAFTVVPGRRDPRVLVGGQSRPDGRRRDLRAGSGRDRGARRSRRRGDTVVAVARVLEAENGNGENGDSATRTGRTPDDRSGRGGLASWRAPRRSSIGEPVDASPSGEQRRDAAVAHGATAARRSARRQARDASADGYERRYRQTIRKVDLWSVLKISICFYLTALDRRVGRGRGAVVDRVGGRDRRATSRTSSATS